MRTSPGACAEVAAAGGGDPAPDGVPVEAEQVVDVGLGAEAPAADAHTVLVAEHRGDQPVITAVDGEGDHAEIRTGRTEEGHPRHGRQPPAGVDGESLLAGGDRVQTDLTEPARRSGQGDGPQQVRAARLDPVRQVGPHDVVERHRTHGAAAALVGIAAHAVPPGDQRSRPVRGVQLVRRQGDCIEVLGVVVRAHVDGPVRGELGGVDEDPTADGVDLRRHPVHVRHDAGDVRRAGHGEQCDATGVPCQLGVEVLLVHGSVDQRSDVDHLAEPSPRQQVRVVLEDGRQHDRVVGRRHRPGEVIDRLGGVLREHHDVAVGVGADEPADDVASLLEGGGAEPGLVATAAVHAGRQRREPLHRLGHGPQRWGRGGVVEVDVWDEPAVEQRHQLVHADDLVAQRRVAVGLDSRRRCLHPHGVPPWAGHGVRHRRCLHETHPPLAGC